MNPTELHMVLRVVEELVSMGAEPTLTNADLVLCKAAVEYGMGPNDTACQIIDNRRDAAGVPVEG